MKRILKRLLLLTMCVSLVIGGVSPLTVEAAAYNMTFNKDSINVAISEAQKSLQTTSNNNEMIQEIEPTDNTNQEITESSVSDEKVDDSNESENSTEQDSPTSMDEKTCNDSNTALNIELTDSANQEITENGSNTDVNNSEDSVAQNLVDIVDEEDLEAESTLISTTDANGFLIEGTTLTGYTGTATNITIPDGVTKIGDRAFYYNYSVISIMMPDSVIEIGNEAFYQCTSLANVTLSSGVTGIGDSAFSGCESLSSMIIPSKITSIGNYVFNGCTSLTSLTLPGGVTSIGDLAFSTCTSLVSITIPNGVTSIGDSAFSNCTNLTNLEIPDSVTTIGANAFVYCVGLTSITIPDSVSQIEKGAFAYCKGLTSIIIPNSITSIEMNLFAGCNGLTNITIPDTVTNIGENAFWNCEKLTNIVIPKGVTSIKDYTFSSCYNLKSISLPDSVTSIGSSAFSHCRELTSITIPTSVISIAKNAFWACNGGKVGTSNQDVSSNKDLFTIYCNANSYAYLYAQEYSQYGIRAVTSQNESETTNEVWVNSIALNVTKVTLAKKATIQLISTVSPSDVTNSKVIWSSDNEKVATVDASGKVKAIAEGSAVIKVMAQDGSNVTAICNVTVSKGKSYKITYKLNKGKNAASNPTYYAAGNKVKLDDPTRKNYTFIGWYIGDKKVSSISKSTNGTITLTAKWQKVKVDKTIIKNAKNKNTGTVVVTFDKMSDVKGYTVYYSTNKKLKNATSVNVSSKKKSATITGLSKGTTYYVTVKAYKVDSQGNQVEGKSNKIIKVKVKK